MGIKLRNTSGGAVELEASPTITTEEKYYLAPMTGELKVHLAAGGAMPGWDGVIRVGAGAENNEKIYPDGTITAATSYDSYIKYPNGRLVCEGVAVGSDVGGNDVVYPTTFIENPRVTFGMNNDGNSSGNSYTIRTHGTYTTLFNIIVLVRVAGSSTSSFSASYFYWQAVGRWKA